MVGLRRPPPAGGANIATAQGFTLKKAFHKLGSPSTRALDLKPSPIFSLTYLSATTIKGTLWHFVGQIAYSMGECMQPAERDDFECFKTRLNPLAKTKLKLW